MLIKIARKSGAIKKYLTSFADRYEAFFSAIRHEPLTILEIGIGGYKDPNKGGGSLRMWAEYFPNSVIVGLDSQQKILNLPANVRVEQGSQTDVELLDSLVNGYNGFDIVIDDASHVTKNTIISFEALRPYTRMFYVVEDLHMASAIGTRNYFQQVPGADFETPNLCVIKNIF
jgi:demethylmacrocin O-methyltransferase